MTTVREYNADQNGFSPIHWNSWKTTWTGTDVNKKVGKWRDVRRKGRQPRVRTVKLQLQLLQNNQEQD